MKADAWRYWLKWSHDSISVRDHLIHITHLTNYATEIQRIEENFHKSRSNLDAGPLMQCSVIAVTLFYLG